MPILAATLLMAASMAGGAPAAQAQWADVSTEFPPLPDQTPAFVRAAEAFLATLSDAQRSAALYGWADQEQRRNWSNFPEGVQRVARCHRYRVRKLELFGSAVSDQYRYGESDLDFLVEFEPLPLGAYADAFFGLVEALEDLFGRPVDLVVSSAIKNPYFRQSIESNKALVYAA